MPPALTGTSAHGSCSHVPLLVILTGLHYGDALGCDLTWLINTVAQILITCCPNSLSSHNAGANAVGAGLGQGTPDWCISHAALQLFIALEAQVWHQGGRHDHARSSTWSQAAHHDLLCRLVPAVGRVTGSLGALELGCTLADWALGHYDVFAS